MGRNEGAQKLPPAATGPFEFERTLQGNGFGINTLGRWKPSVGKLTAVHLTRLALTKTLCYFKKKLGAEYEGIQTHSERDEVHGAAMGPLIYRSAFAMTTTSPD
jgi:hypothetical protein